jgi:hypothetical protein
MQRLCICTCTILKLRYGASVGPDVLDLCILGIWLFLNISDEILESFLEHYKDWENKFPGPFTSVISLPLNKILQLSSNDS